MTAPRLLGGLLGLLLIASPATAEERPDALTVIGEGQVRVVPDRAILQVSVSHQSDTVAAAVRACDETVSRFLTAARALGAGDRELLAGGSSIHPNYVWDEASRRQVLDGYRVSREVTVTVSELAKLGRYLSAATEAGMNGMQPARLTVADEREPRDEALARAAADARRQAGVLAGALGVRLGAARQIDVVEDGASPMPMVRHRMMAAESGGDASPVEAGELDIVRRVRVVFALEP